MNNFLDYNPPDINEHKSFVDGYDFDKRLKTVDGKVYEVVDEENGGTIDPPISTLQTESFVLDAGGKATLSVTGFSGILTDNSKYEIYFEGQRKFFTNGDFTYASNVITSTNGADDEGLKCFLKIY